MEMRDQVPDREKHMIQSPKLMRTFVWNLHGFQVVDAMPCHAMPKGEMFTADYDTTFALLPTEIVARHGERGERKLVMYADDARPHPTKVTRACCDDNFLRIASHPRHSPYSPDFASSDVFLLGHLKNRLQSKHSNWGLQMNFVPESEKFWTKSALTIWKWFSSGGSTDWTDALQHCNKWKGRGMKQTMVH
jgi:hypothetical protein